MGLRTAAGRAALGSAGASVPLIASACLILAATTGPLAAQSVEGGWSVVSARMVADLTAADGAATVTMHYVLSGTPRGVALPLDRAIPLELLGFGDATAEDFAVGDDAPVVLWPTVGTHRRAEVSAPDGAQGAVLPLELSYRVERAVEGTGPGRRARVPVISGPSAPESGPAGGFEARVILPPEWRLTEGFPSGLRADGPGSWSVGLSVVPAVLDFRIRTDGRWRPGFPLLVDVLTLLILGTFATFGWRHLRGRAAAVGGSTP